MSAKHSALIWGIILAFIAMYAYRKYTARRA